MKVLVIMRNQRIMLLVGLSLFSIFGIVLAGIGVSERIKFKESVNTTFQQPTDEVREISQKNKALSQDVNRQKDRCTLIREVNSSPESIFGSNCYGKIIRWRDYLFFSEVKENKSGTVSSIILFSYNLVTGEKKEIYSLNEHRKDFPRRLPYDVTFLDVIEDRLFFSLGGHMSDSGLYSFNLSSAEGKLKLITTNFTRIEYWSGGYWLYGGFGDACVGSQIRATFSPSTQEIGKKITIQQGCNDGERFVGATGREIYVQKYTQQNISAMEMDGISTPKIQEIYSLDIHTLKKKNILNSEKFSGTVSDALYLYSKQIFLLLVGDELVSYSSENQKSEKIVDITWGASDSRLSQVGDRICLDWSDEIDLENKKIIQDQEDCKQSQVDSSIPEKIKQMNLPAEFSMEVAY